MWLFPLSQTQPSCFSVLLQKLTNLVTELVDIAYVAAGVNDITEKRGTRITFNWPSAEDMYNVLAINFNKEITTLRTTHKNSVIVLW